MTNPLPNFETAILKEVAARPCPQLKIDGVALRILLERGLVEKRQIDGHDVVHSTPAKRVEVRITAAGIAYLEALKA